MSLPTLVKSYNFFYKPSGSAIASTNILLSSTGTEATDHKNLMYKIKEVLINMCNSGGTYPSTSARWVVKGSCDGAGNFGTNDNVDRWASGTNCIWQNSASSVAHSWIVFEVQALATSTKYQVCIDLNSNNGGLNRNFTLKFSPSDGFGTANGGTNGTATTAPTATDEIIIMGGTVSSAARWNGQITATYTSRLHVMSSTDGTITRVIVLVAGSPIIFWNFEALNNAVTGFTKFGLMNARSGQTAADSVMTNRWWTTPAETGGACVFRGPGSPGTLGTACYTSEGLVSNCLGNIITTPNDIDSNWPILPIGYASQVAGVRGRHGTIYDLWYGSTGVATGDDYPVSPAHQFAQFGNIIVPWDGSTPTVS